MAKARYMLIVVAASNKVWSMRNLTSPFGRISGEELEFCIPGKVRRGDPV